jgi:hypothetical protein
MRLAAIGELLKAKPLIMWVVSFFFLLFLNGIWTNKQASSRTKDFSPPPKHCNVNDAGEDLLSIAVDQPFRFPATFTFVVRAFSGDDDAHHLLTLETVVCRNSCCYLPICFV